jgi:hypothetical protein
MSIIVLIRAVTHAWELKHGKKIRCKHAFRSISAGFASIQLGIQGLDQKYCTKFYIFTNFSTSARQIYKVLLRITRSAHDRAISGAKSLAGKYGITIKYYSKGLYTLANFLSNHFFCGATPTIFGKVVFNWCLMAK